MRIEGTGKNSVVSKCMAVRSCNPYTPRVLDSYCCND
jgi:hypothetical protein